MSQNSEKLDRLPPIPIPPYKRWREFRMEVAPLFVFAAAIATVVYIWRQNIAAPTLQGEVEAVRANVTSPQAGILTQLKVSRFQKVTQGEAVATVMPTDPRLPLALIQSEMDILRARLEPRLSQQRNATDYERLRLEWLLQKVDLASDRVSLVRAESEFKRSADLLQAKLISEELYEVSLRNRDRLVVEVDEKTKLIADLEQGLQRLAILGDPQAPSPTADVVLAGIQAQEEKLKLAEAGAGPITLVAPLTGMVSSVFRNQGENVVNGEPIIAISSLQSEHIVGYLRQPFPVEPEVGMPVEVRTRATRSVSRLSRILQVGAQLEPITNSLAMLKPGNLVDMGLPIEVNLPPDLKVRPGELVDLIIRPH